MKTDTMNENEQQAKMEVRCGTCYFFHPQSNAQNIGSRQGLCRRYPPQIWGVSVPARVPNLAVPNGNAIQVQISAHWPTVSESGLCGEHPRIREVIDYPPPTTERALNEA